MIEAEPAHRSRIITIARGAAEFLSGKHTLEASLSRTTPARMVALYSVAADL